MPALKHVSTLPHGVILLTGPTGSGKTTTLYATLSRINSEEVKIITVEADPAQMENIARERPELVRELMERSQAWRPTVASPWIVMRCITRRCPG